MIIRWLPMQVWIAVLFILGGRLFNGMGFVEAAAAGEDVAGRANDSLLWGPYRPNLYFGVRPRIPKSLLTGLLWSRVEDFQSIQNTFRHTCEQHQGMAGYGWEEYDPRTGGRQIVRDAENGIDLTTEFVKFPGGSNGGSWGARIKGVPRADAASDLKTMVVFYVGRDGLGSLDVSNEYNELGYDETVTLDGDVQGLGEFNLEITQGPPSNKHPRPQHPSYKKRPLYRTAVRTLQVPEAAFWQGKPVLFSEMKKEFDANLEQYGKEALPPPWAAFVLQTNNPASRNMFIVQKVFEGAFEFDVLFSSNSASKPITSKELTESISSTTKSFSERYNQVFKATAPFDKSKYNAFSKSMFSNLVGGIGYFYGDSIVDRSYAEEYEEENEGFWEEAAEARARDQHAIEGPHELFTSVPSRPFFPRGFLWDEGFHLLPILEWDADLALEIINSWFSLVDEDGWIAREQILGAEARSKVPAEFQVQYPHYANPPTLFLVLQVLLDKLSSPRSSLSESQRRKYKSELHALYPLLKRHFFWFRKTQYGDLKSYDRSAFSSKEAYRWRGRTPRHILPSGLDDYPRAQPPHPGELHVDLISWVGIMTRAIKGIATVLDETEDVKEFSKYEEAVVRNIDDLHWSEQESTYCDASVDDYEESVLVCHKGYISIFPFLTGLLKPDNPKLGKILDLIGDPDELWSNHGIRSLSKKDALYETDENYWRSPVWMNLNYLILENLLKTAQQTGLQQAKSRDLYNRLRKNLVDTVYASWKDTGFAWEQYNPDTGAGQRTQHFTGWTSLVVKIMCMPDLTKQGSPQHGEL